MYLWNGTLTSLAFTLAIPHQACDKIKGVTWITIIGIT